MKYQQESERELYRKPNSIKTTSSTAPPFLSFTRISFISSGSLRVKFHETRKMIKLEKAIKLHKSALKLLPDISENILRDFPEKNIKLGLFLQNCGDINKLLRAIAVLNFPHNFCLCSNVNDFKCFAAKSLPRGH